MLKIAVNLKLVIGFRGNNSCVGFEKFNSYLLGQNTVRLTCFSGNRTLLTDKINQIYS